MAEEAEDILEDEVVDVGHEEDKGGQQEAVDTPEEPKPFDPEAVARLAGWAPKDEWRGDPEEWKDAPTFLVDTVAVNKSLRTRLKDVETTTQRITRTADRIIEENRRKAVAEAEARVRQAVEYGDADAAIEATRQLNQVNQPGTQEDPVVADFMARNTWFGVDDAATAVAHTVANKLAAQGMDNAAQVNAAEAEVRRRFPELFGEQPEARRQAKAPPPVHSGQRTPASAPKQKGVRDLPPEALKAGQDFERRGRCTLAEYAKTYFEENA
ncbi:MAG: hypothetical protein ACM3W4_02080 [Ignavibacteriales bacterium]